MKRLTLFAIPAIAVLSLGSCKKDFTCTCTITTYDSYTPSGSTAQISTSTQTETTQIKKVTTSDGNAACVGGTSSQTTNGSGDTEVTTTTKSCTLK
jgi:hypothetical protein